MALLTLSDAFLLTDMILLVCVSSEVVDAPRFADGLALLCMAFSDFPSFYSVAFGFLALSQPVLQRVRKGSPPNSKAVHRSGPLS